MLLLEGNRGSGRQRGKERGSLRYRLLEEIGKRLIALNVEIKSKEGTIEDTQRPGTLSTHEDTLLMCSEDLVGLFCTHSYGQRGDEGL